MIMKRASPGIAPKDALYIVVLSLPVLLHEFAVTAASGFFSVVMSFLKLFVVRVRTLIEHHIAVTLE